LQKFAKKKFLDYFTTFFELKWRGEEYCKTALTSPVIDDIFNSHINKPFELVITEFYNSDCMLGLAYLLNVPFVGVTSCTMSPWHYARIYMEEDVRGVSYQERFPTWWKQKIVSLLYRYIHFEKCFARQYKIDLSKVGRKER
jgi:glucuronosyltransferase